MVEETSINLDCSQLSPRELCERLQGLEPQVSVRLSGLRDGEYRDAVAAGLAQEISLRIDSRLGAYSFFLGELANVEVHGDVGDCCGHSMSSGSLLVHGHAGNYAGAYAQGGFLAILGQAKWRCGQGLAGANVFVRSTVGDEAGYGMRSGVLVLGNGAGEGLGAAMQGGVIYVRGDIKSKAAHVGLVRLKDTDSMRLSLLLVRAGIKGGAAEFRAYKPKVRER